jgi:hypothetical protein
MKASHLGRAAGTVQQQVYALDIRVARPCHVGILYFVIHYNSMTLMPRKFFSWSRRHGIWGTRGGGGVKELGPLLKFNAIRNPYGDPNKAYNGDLMDGL